MADIYYDEDDFDEPCDDEEYPDDFADEIFDDEDLDEPCDEDDDDYLYSITGDEG